MTDKLFNVIIIKKGRESKCITQEMCRRNLSYEGGQGIKINLFGPVRANAFENLNKMDASLYIHFAPPEERETGN